MSSFAADDTKERIRDVMYFLVAFNICPILVFAGQGCLPQRVTHGERIEKNLKLRREFFFSPKIYLNTRERLKNTSVVKGSYDKYEIKLPCSGFRRLSVYFS